MQAARDHHCGTTAKPCTVARLAPSPSSSGLGHRPFTAVTRVRFPLGTPVKANKNNELRPPPRVTKSHTATASPWPQKLSPFAARKRCTPRRTVSLFRERACARIADRWSRSLARRGTCPSACSETGQRPRCERAESCILSAPAALRPRSRQILAPAQAADRMHLAEEGSLSLGCYPLSPAERSSSGTRGLPARAASPRGGWGSGRGTPPLGAALLQPDLSASCGRACAPLKVSAPAGGRQLSPGAGWPARGCGPG